MTTDQEGYFWPTREQELLLKAALLKGEAAITAWKSWAAVVDFDRLDAGSQRLLPLLYKNLTDQNVRHPVLDVYKGFYRMNWYKNRLLCHRITQVLRLLNDHGIDALLLKGAALVSLYYKDWALRPMNDFDLLVEQDRIPKAIGLLRQNGWRPSESLPDEADFQTRHACTLTDDSGIEFDLHWRILHESGCQEMDDAFKQSAMRIDFCGVPVSVLSHTDQLFHVLIHGVRWNAIAPLRWVPDAIMISREAESHIDWRRLLQEARHRRLVVSLKKSLTHLYREFAAPIPGNVIEAMDRIKPSAAERLEFWMNSRPRGLVRDFVYLWFTHVRTAGASGSIGLFLRFPAFLRTFWKAPAKKNTAGFLLGRLVRRILNGAGASPGQNPAA